MLFFIPLTMEAEIKSIGVIVFKEWRGEYSFALRIKSACENLGWNAKILTPDSFSTSFQKFDWVLTLVPTTKCLGKDFPNYLVLFDPENHYFEEKVCLKSGFCDYFGYIATFKNHTSIRSAEQLKPVRIYPNPWYPTAQYRPFQEVSPNYLFFFIGQWGNRLKDIEYKVLQKELANQYYTNFFGNPGHGVLYERVYKGEIPYTSESIQDRIFDCGVCLVLHSDIHIKHEIPSGRIFEAAAAASVIISDMNPFVKKHFGDSVLYIDHTKSGELMFAEIDAHMRWILDFFRN